MERSSEQTAAELAGNYARNHLNLLGKPHFELIDRYGYKEALLDRYESKAEAEAEKTMREQIHWHAGELVIRARAF